MYMSSMNEDHGSEQNRDGGVLGGNDQPDDPAARQEPTTMKSPPNPAAGPGPTHPVAAPSEQVALAASLAGASTKASLGARPPKDPSATERPDEIPESFANVARVVERSAMCEKDRLEIFLDMLRQMSPTLHAFAVASGWDSCRIGQLFVAAPAAPAVPIPPSDLPGRDGGGDRLLGEHAAVHALDAENMPSTRAADGTDICESRSRNKCPATEDARSAERSPGALANNDQQDEACKGSNSSPQQEVSLQNPKFSKPSGEVCTGVGRTTSAHRSGMGVAP